MIVNLNIQNKKIVVIGGGKEAQKRVRSVTGQGCNITVISDTVCGGQIGRLVKAKKIKFIKQKITDTKFITKLKPDLIITTTDDTMLNQRIIRDAKRRRIIAYSSDSPKDSDFSNPAIINFGNEVQVAIFTGGSSPAMSKKIRCKSEEMLKKIITKEDIAQIKIQRMARKMAKDVIPTQEQRKRYLCSIISDASIDQLIKDGQIKKAERQVRTTLKNWK